MHSDNTIYDFIGIGVGPMNLGLACLTDPIVDLNAIFIDKSTGFNWHPGMMLEDTTLQIPFIGDLVTLADPTSPYSFLNFLKEKGKIYSFYIRENFLVLRKEYNQYCQWVIDKLDTVFFNREVANIVYDELNKIYVVHVLNHESGKEFYLKSKKLVLGTGTQRYIPKCCKPFKDIFTHSSTYLNYKKELQSKSSITVVGSGQSAAEIFYDLLQDIEKGYTLNWVTRSPRFFPLEYTKLTLEMTSPEYVDYFYHLPDHAKKELLSNQKHLYKGINQDLINAIFDLLYIKNLDDSYDVNLLTNTELMAVDYDSSTKKVLLHFNQVEQQSSFSMSSEGVVLATGYHYQQPGFIQGIEDRIQWKEDKYHIHRNYAIDREANEIFVQNAELHTHGFVTPDLGMACYRNSYILKEITGKEYYSIEKQIAFQHFGALKNRTPEVALTN